MTLLFIAGIAFSVYCVSQGEWGKAVALIPLLVFIAVVGRNESERIEDEYVRLEAEDSRTNRPRHGRRPHTSAGRTQTALGVLSLLHRRATGNAGLLPRAVREEGSGDDSLALSGEGSSGVQPGSAPLDRGRVE